MKKIFSVLLVLAMLLAALIVPVSADEAQVPEVLGASIRTEGEQGLRFIGRIKKDGDIPLTLGDDANFGFIIIPESSTDGSAIDKDTQYAKKVKAVNLLGSGIVEAAGLTYNADYYYFSVVQKGIPANFYTTQLVVKAYVDNGGTYIYSDNPTKEKRSIQYVAQQLVNGGDENPAYAAILETAAVEGSDIYVNADRFSVLETYPAYPDCIARDNLYTVSVSRGLVTEPLLVYNQTASYAQFEPTEKSRSLAALDSNRRFCEFAFAYDSVTVNIKVNKNFNSYVVSPTSKGFASTYNNGVISVTLEKPEQFVVILDDDYNTALSVFADAPEYDVPTKGASKVVYVEGDSVITLPESQPELVTYAGPNDEIMVVHGQNTKIYLAPGAVLKKGIFISRTEEESGYASKIYGRGAVLDPYSDYKASNATVAVPLTDWNGTSNVSYSALKAVINCYAYSCSLKDIKVLDGRRFNVLFGQSGCTADNVKILSTEMSTDGFMCSQNATVKNSFVYNGDNSLVIQGGDGGHLYENITIGTTCAAIYPQYSFNGSLKDIYVFRADDNLINVHQDNSGAMTVNIDGLDALDCVKVPLIFGDNGDNGSEEKVFNIKNLATRYTTGAKLSFTPGTYTSQNDALESGSTGYIFNFTNLYVGGHRIGPDNDGSSIKVGSAYHGANTTGGNTTSGMTLNFAYDSADTPAHTSVPANNTANYTGGADYVAGPIRGWTEHKSYNCKVAYSSSNGGRYTVSETEDSSKWGFSFDLTEIMKANGPGTYTVQYTLSKTLTVYLVTCANNSNAPTKSTKSGTTNTISVTVTASDLANKTYQVVIRAASASTNSFELRNCTVKKGSTTISIPW